MFLVPAGGQGHSLGERGGGGGVNVSVTAPDHIHILEKREREGERARERWAAGGTPEFDPDHLRTCGTAAVA